MVKQFYKIDDKGFLVFGQELLLGPEDAVPEMYISEGLPTDSEGFQLPFYKPKWTGSEWIESLPQKELEELLTPTPTPPTDAERIDVLEETIMFLLMGGA